MDYLTSASVYQCPQVCVRVCTGETCVGMLLTGHNHIHNNIHKHRESIHPENVTKLWTLVEIPLALPPPFCIYGHLGGTLL